MSNIVVLNSDGNSSSSPTQRVTRTHTPLPSDSQARFSLVMSHGGLPQWRMDQTASVIQYLCYNQDGDQEWYTRESVNSIDEIDYDLAARDKAYADACQSTFGILPGYKQLFQTVRQYYSLDDIDIVSETSIEDDDEMDGDHATPSSSDNLMDTTHILRQMSRVERSDDVIVISSSPPSSSPMPLPLTSYGDISQDGISDLMDTASDTVGVLPDRSLTDVYDLALSDETSNLPSFVREFLQHLCSLTGTRAIELSVAQTFKICIEWLDHTELTIDIEQNTVMTKSIFSLLVMVWLMLSYQQSTGSLPKQNLVWQCGALKYAAWKCEYNIFFDTLHAFEAVINAWQDQLFLRLFKFDQFKTFRTADEFPTRDSVPCHMMELLNCLDSPAPSVKLAMTLVEVDIEDGITPVAALVAHDPDKNVVITETALMLASVDVSVLRACIEGTLAQDMLKAGSTVRAELELNRETEEDSVIYINILADRAGLSPSPSQFQEVVDILLQYVDQSGQYNAMSEEVDFAFKPPKSWSKAFNKLGYRRFLDKKDEIDRTWKKSIDRRERVKSFTERLMQRLNDDFGRGNGLRPLSRPLCEIGYTKNPTSRLKDHATLRKSNCLMAITFSVLQWKFPDSFVLHQHILHSCWRQFQPWLGEVFFTTLCDASTKYAGGFSHHAPGCSNGSAFRTITGQTFYEWELRAIDRFDPYSRLERERDESDKVCERLRNEETERLRQEQANAQKSEDLDNRIAGLKALDGLLDIVDELRNQTSSNETT